MKTFIEDIFETFIWVAGIGVWGAWAFAYGLSRIWKHQAHRAPRGGRWR